MSSREGIVQGHGLQGCLPGPRHVLSRSRIAWIPDRISHSKERVCVGEIGIFLDRSLQVINGRLGRATAGRSEGIESAKIQILSFRIHRAVITKDSSVAWR